MSDVVRRYYDESVKREWERLDNPYRRFELAGTLSLIDGFFPASGEIIDIGGGPGRYAIELASRGYKVTLVDISPKAIGFAGERLAELNLEAKLICADARDLSVIGDSSFDAGLILGPMYHIVGEEGRSAALAELHRILKPGAPAIVGFINPWGILRSGLTEFPGEYAEYERVASLLSTCVQVGEQEAFTEAAFLTPPHAIGELRAAGFAIETRAGVEGFAAGMLDEVEEIASLDRTAYENILRLVVATSTSPPFRDCTEHLHIVVRKIG